MPGRHRRHLSRQRRALHGQAGISHRGPVPTGTYVVDCKAIADDIEQARAEAEQERQQALHPSAAPTYQGRATMKDVWVPEECADDLEDRGLKTR